MLPLNVFQGTDNKKCKLATKEREGHQHNQDFSRFVEETRKADTVVKDSSEVVVQIRFRWVVSSEREDLL